MMGFKQIVKLRKLRDAVRDVQCPKCKAGAGERCRLANGAKVARATNHRERITAARRAGIK